MCCVRDAPCCVMLCEAMSDVVLLMKGAARHLPYCTAQQRTMRPGLLHLRCFVSLARYSSKSGYVRQPSQPRRSMGGQQHDLHNNKGSDLYGTIPFEIRVRTSRQCMGVSAACLRIFASQLTGGTSLQARALPSCSLTVSVL